MLEKGKMERVSGYQGFGDVKQDKASGGPREQRDRARNTTRVQRTKVVITGGKVKRI
jgi:hypothetical protein